MKATRFLAITIIAALAFSGCSKDDNGIDPGTGGNTNTGNIVFNIGIKNPAEVSASETSITTRTSTAADFKTSFVDGDEIGLFAVKHAASNPATLAATGNYTHNVKLTYSSADGDKWISESDLWHASGSDVLDFYAYYPYDVDVTDPTDITFNVLADQSTAVNYNASDLLSASAANISSSPNPVTLTFSHLLSLVQVEVGPGTNKGSGPVETLALTLLGCKAGGTFNLGDGSLTISDEAVVVQMLRVEADPITATTYTYRALVPAQSVAKDASLCLMSQNGQLYSTPKLGTELTLEAGAAKLYTTKLPITALLTVKIPAGSFQMGSPENEPRRNKNELQHNVELTKAYYMSRYTVTNAQYAAFLNANSIGSNGEGSVTYHKDDLIGTAEETQIFIFADSWGLKHEDGKWLPQSNYDNYPIINVTWFGAVAYANWVGGSLPTEAQWEYACRAGTETAYSFGDNSTNNIGNYAWSLENAEDMTHLVGEKLPNAWGVYDMHANVYEWCSDWYVYDYDSTPATDPAGPASGSTRVLRGGSWSNSAQYCRSASREKISATSHYNFAGFRVVFVPQ